MIISKTPLRINFSGGATTLEDYRNAHGGVTLNATIDKHVYIIIKERVDNDLWLKYSKNEIVKNVDEIKNEIWKECLIATGVTKGIEIAAMTDIPKGFGLGAANAFTVGSLNALFALLGKYKSEKELAKKSIEVGTKTFRKNGFQDCYSLACGGLNILEFGKNKETTINPIIISKSLKRSLSENLLLFSLEAEMVVVEPNSIILTNQERERTLHKIKEIVYSTRDALHSSDLRRFGELLHENWEQKKKVISTMSNPEIDRFYNLALEAGAIGGKMCRSPTSGRFLLVYVEPEKQDNVRIALRELKELPISLESFGSKIIHFGEE